MTDTATPNTPVNTTPVGTTAGSKPVADNNAQILVLENGRSVQLNAPTEAGQNAVVLAKGLDKIVANFDADKVDISMNGENLVFTFENGSQTVVEQFELADPMPQIVLQDGTIVAGDVVVAQLEADGVESLDLETAAGGARSGGGSTYSDDLGDVIGMLNATDGDNLVSGDGNGGNGGALFSDGDRGLGGFGPTNTTPIVGPGGAANFVSDETTNIGSVINGTLNINFGTDGIGNIEGTGFSSSNLLSSDGQQITVSYNATTNTYTATIPGGAVVFTLVLNQNGTYTFTQLLPLDHPNTNNPNDTISLNFGIIATDGDGDSVNTQILVTINDDGPTALNSNLATDESSDLGVAFVGDLNIDFGADGAGSVAGNGNFTAPTNLTSNGQIIHIEYDPSTGTYTGMVSMAGQGSVPTVMVPVFTLIINPDGTYSFTQHAPIDHNGEGSVNLGFGYTATDGDGDSATGVINITVSDDTFPIISTEGTTSTMDESGDINSSVNGAVNVNFGADGFGNVNATGAFSVLGADGAPLTVNGGTPVTVVFDPATGTYTAFAGNSEEMVFTMVINADGTYTFTLYSSIDHPDGMDPNDAVTLVFGYTATDSDGDSAGGAINIVIRDDAPVASNDTATINVNDNLPLTGNLLGNDTIGNDGPGSVAGVPDPNAMVGPNVTMVGPLVSVTFNGTVYNMPDKGSLVINGQYGTLTVGANGSYSYSPYPGATIPPGAQETFSYTIIDRDGDTSTANLNIIVRNFNGQGNPTLGEEGTNSTIDETNAFNEPGTVSPPWANSFVNGSVNVNFGPDGQGTVAGNGNFTGPNGVELTSNGEPIIVTYDAATGTYTGTTAYGQATVFFLEVRPDGSYVFRLIGALDHPDGSNPDDALTLQFGFIATDADGDAVNGTINIVVRDDGPVAVDDIANADITDKLPLTGNLLDNDDFGADGRSEGNGDVVIPGQTGAVSTVTVNGVTYEIPSVIPRGHDGPTPITIMGEYGRLTIDCNGNYSYEPFPDVDVPEGAQDIFTYTIVDGDGDTSTANLIINVGNGDDGNPIINPNGAANINIDETAGIGVTVNGQLNIDFGPDGAGSIALTGNVTMPQGQQLTSGGFPIVFTVVSTDPMVLQGWTDPTLVDSRAASLLAFEITINQDGTYSFTQFMPLDHPDGTNPNDILSFGIEITVTDADGDSATGTINIGVADDAPYLVDVRQTDPSMIEGEVKGIFDQPINVAFGVDGQGSILGTGTFTVQGGQPLTSDGQPVIVTFDAATNTYTGMTAGGTLVFTMTIQPDATFDFVLHGNIDHLSPGSSLGLVFGFQATDGDGDSVIGTIPVHIIDNGDSNPIPVNPIINVDETTDIGTVINGNMNINFGPDGAGRAFLDIGNVQPASGELTSGGLPVQYSYIKTMPPTLEAFVVDAKGNIVPVFTLHVNADGTYRFEMFQGIDHPDGTNPNDVLPITFGVVVQDADGDSTISTLTINVADDGPVASNDVGISDIGDKEPLMGNLVANDDLGADGQGGITSITFNGVVYQMPDGTGNQLAVALDTRIPSVTIQGQYGVLTVFANGQYSYVPNGASGGNGRDVFSYTVTDGDGDTATATLTISATGGTNSVPTIVTTSTSMDESTNIVGLSGQMSINYGADGQGANGGIDGTGVFSSTAGAQLTSGGVAVVVTYDAATQTYTGMAGTNLVFTLTLYDNGEYGFGLLRPLDNQGANGQQIGLTFGVQITDSNGDTATANFNIVVRDDMPVANATTLTVNEPGASSVVNGTINIDYGADGAGSVTANGGLQILDANGNPLTSLTSNGHPIVIENFNGGYVVSDTVTGNVVIRVWINSDGTYTFQMFQPLDGPQGQALQIVAGYTATDGDGDTVNGTINVTVNDSNVVDLGNPTISPNGLSTYLFQENYFGDIGGAPQVVTGVAMEFSYGPDGQGATGGIDGTGVFGATIGASTTPIALTFSTIPIVVAYNAATGTYTGSAAGLTVFTLKLNDNGTYDFTLVRPIDHPANSGFNDSIRLTFGVQITDADGDTATANLNISIQDGTPVASQTVGSVNEADFPNAAFSVINTGGQLNYNFGGDGGDTLRASNSFNVTGTQNLSSGGIPVTVTLHPNVGQFGSFADRYEGRDSFGNLIFELTIYKANGVYSYSFVQYEQLDHPSGSNSLQLQFGYAITDNDGDVANSTININVVDNGVNITATPDHELMDLQQNTPISGNMLENDQFTGSVELISVYHPNNPGIVYHPVVGAPPAEIQGLYGTFTVYADGSYTYQIRPNFNPPNGQYEKLVYVIEDANGNTSTAQLDVRFINGQGIPTIEPGGPGVSYTMEVDVINSPVTGQLDFSYGADGQGVNGGVKVVNVSNSIGSFTVMGVPVTSTWSEFSQSFVGMAGTLKVFTLYVGDNGAYSFTLHHPFDSVSTSYLNFSVIVTDSNGDRAGIPIVVSFDDNVTAGIAPVAQIEDEVILPIVIAPVVDGDEIHIKPVEEQIAPIDEVYTIGILPQPEPVLEFSNLVDAELQPAVALNDKIIEVDYSYEKGDVIDLSELIDVSELTEGGKALEAFVNYDPNDGILTVDSTGTGNFTSEEATRLDMVGFDGGKVKLAIEDMIVDTEFK